MSNDKKTITISGQSDKVDSVMYSNDKQPTTIEQVEHYKAYAVNHYKDLPLDVLKYITVLTEYSEQVKEQNKQLAEALHKIENGTHPYNEREALSFVETSKAIANEALTNYQNQIKP